MSSTTELVVVKQAHEHYGSIYVFLLLQKARVYKEVVEIRKNSGSPRGGRQRIVPPPPLRVSSVAGGTRSSDQEQHVLRHQRRQQNWNHNETKITKFRKTVWGVFLVTHDFDPLDENEIAIRKGEHVSVWNQDDRDWFWVVKHASSGQEEGFVPSGCLREVSTDSKVPSVICKLNNLNVEIALTQLRTYVWRHAWLDLEKEKFVCQLLLFHA